METRVEMLVHPLSNPGAAGICPEMLEVAEEVNRAGDYSLAAEIYTSQLADLQHPDRGLCLRKADCLTQAGRISEALDSYCTAASLGKLHPEELPLLVDTIARTLREKELGFPGPGGKSSSSSEEEGVESDGECGDDEALDLFSCRLCKCLLHEPTTVECGHTFCKICLEDEAITECVQCKEQFNEKKDGLPNDRRLDVVLSGLLDKLFATESKARKFWIEGQVLWGEKKHSEALEKYNAAVDLAPSIGRLLCQRAELHVEMRNFSLAMQDASSLCRIKPHWTKAHSLKATALSEAGRNDEALQEYLMCVALKPNWTKVKLQAQKVLSEVFSSVFENGNMPLHPLQGGVASRLIKPPALLMSLRPQAQRPSSSSQDSEFSVSKGSPVDDSSSRLSPPEGSTKSLAEVLAALPAPPGGVKRKHSGEGPSAGTNHPTKLLRPDEAGSSQTVSVCGGRTFPAELLDSGDMECPLCMRLFYEPVATPCGHTFCLKCLERCLDHKSNCPLCKENLSEYLATRGYNKTLLMEEVLQRYLGDELADRKTIHEEERKELSNLKPGSPCLRVHHGLPHHPLPAARVRAALPPHDPPLHGDGHQAVRHVHRRRAQRLRRLRRMLEVRDVKFFLTVAPWSTLSAFTV
ncbi:LON peptidase N-terminal domain and RING finger protein 2-like [Trematomus bernacchii]|uniref:LON peptidase N-terminal domain and RING finger protein 2-like n=1 Tax=Trematomus bernacchii TaxID=40690 RepID=UPI00146B6725|nr:LON peptidase N-terminal domain and RING finger protein 2-like [Trematomus bernacchii]XP_034002528.1 LON peptidase N-terminal domain and RING finger protein 2-like [Trematomus bernacchii]